MLPSILAFALLIILPVVCYAEKFTGGSPAGASNLKIEIPSLDELKKALNGVMTAQRQVEDANRLAHLVREASDRMDFNQRLAAFMGGNSMVIDLDLVSDESTTLAQLDMRYRTG